LANDIWEQILRLFCDVCEQVRKKWTGNYEWTQKEDMYEVNNRSEEDKERERYLYLPKFQIIFKSKDENGKEKQFVKKLFIHYTATWYNRLRKQTMECWMQELLQKFPQVQHEQYNPFFNVMISRIPSTTGQSFQSYGKLPALGFLGDTQW
jgi:hypothetical protein